MTAVVRMRLPSWSGMTGCQAVAGVISKRSPTILAGVPVWVRISAQTWVSRMPGMPVRTIGSSTSWAAAYWCKAQFLLPCTEAVP